MGAIILGGVDRHRGPVLSSRPRLPYLSTSSRRALDVVRLRADLGRSVRAAGNEAHWRVARRLKGLVNIEVIAADLDILRFSRSSNQTYSNLCCGTSSVDKEASIGVNCGETFLGAESPPLFARHERVPLFFVSLFLQIIHFHYCV